MKHSFKHLVIFFYLFLGSMVFAEDNLASFLLKDYEANTSPMVGSKNADFTIIEFFDYRCGYCSKQADDFSELLVENKNIKIIYLEFPIFGGISEIASLIALKVWKQNPGLYFEVHNGFMNLGPSMKKKSLIEVLNNQGLDGKNIYDSVKGEKNNKIIIQNKALAKRLNLRGTPASIINDTIIPGYVKLSNLRNMTK